ncbi:DUF2844 domain-containing protein [Paraburkholderia rhynchosiae]|uniref:DUF2844 domain-containing protein n=1 Tax=Paraburkholderia rhynchosiae TaxID=487049 RepID=A0A2N7WXS4_9BURK|nr:DUF2844 domain-containing protein [Paraburkholderia rhynchosiae]PMS34164.1 hypothetical protein C0Z16_00950 [Paraburkholderia rhynchosiae]CAB3637337.1 hypothetical protein LMG27174_00186 [Paraburkholderia rhynchosiae]
MRLMKIAMLAVTLLPLWSYAALGGAPSAPSAATSVPFTPTMLLATTPQSASATDQPASGLASAAPYSMRQSVDANGVTIREYVLPNNVVFAVTWDGPIRPNMRALLGSYFPNYVAAGQSGVRGSGPLIEGTDDFRIESAGRLGRFFGMAWVPRLTPASVRPGDLE